MRPSFRQLLRTNVRRLLLIFGAFLAMVLVSSLYVRTIVNHQLLLQGEEMLNTMQAEVSADLSESELFFASLSQTVGSMLASGRDNPGILSFLESINAYYATDHSPLSNFMKVYAEIRGEFLDGSGWVPYAGYAPPERPWYIGALQTEGVFFSEPYVDAETGTTVISFSQKMIDDQGTFVGVLAIDLNLHRLTEYVSGQRLVDGGYGFLVSDEGQLIAHADPELIGKHLAQLDDYIILHQRLGQGEEALAVQLTDLDGTESVVFSRTIFNGWQLGIVSPSAAYFHQANTMTLVLSVLGLLLFTLLSIILLRASWLEMRSEAESRSKSTFLASMSHEIRTPMNAIVGLTHIAKKSDDPQRIREYLMKIDVASDHLLGVINDILDMSKIEAGKMELHEEECLLVPKLWEAANVLAFKLEEKRQHFVFSVDPEVPDSVIVDTKCLNHVVTNLLSNAVKFTPEEGHIELSIHLEAREDTHCVLRVDVTDDGIGISKEKQERLFQAFSQADQSISRQYGGTGLGLLISKNLTELMGGRIWVTSEEGKGSRFSFTFRAGIGGLTLREREPGEASVSTLPDFSGKRLLLAEDLSINREIVAEMLRETAMDILCAENGQEAVELFGADARGFDIILMDVHMPVMNGLEATERLRTLPQGKDVPIIAMTADVFQEDIAKCLAAGMDDHLGKPVREAALFEMLQKHLLPGEEDAPPRG